jgi:hypothetical protein
MAAFRHRPHPAIRKQPQHAVAGQAGGVDSVAPGPAVRSLKGGIPLGRWSRRQRFVGRRSVCQRGRDQQGANRRANRKAAMGLIARRRPFAFLARPRLRRVSAAGVHR